MRRNTYPKTRPPKGQHTLTTTFVSRHQGAIDWANQEGLLPEDSRIVTD